MGPKPKAPEKGICFPKDKKGGRSTSDAGKAIIAASLRGSGTADGDKYLPEWYVEVVDEAGTVVARVHKVLYVRRKPAE